MIVLLPDGANFASGSTTAERSIGSTTAERSIDPVADLLQSSKVIAVVGLSPNPARPSHGVAAYLQAAGYRIIPVNPNVREVLGERSYSRLEEVPEKIDIVDIFRKSPDVPPVVEGAIRVGAKTVWMQLGIEHAEAAEKARRAGLAVVMDACLLVEHKKRRVRGEP